MDGNVIGRKRLLFIRKYMTIVIGAILMALSVNLVYEPLDMVTGGVSGLAIVVKRVTEPLIEGGLPIWLFNIACNIPLFLAAVIIKGKRFLLTTFVGTIAYILALYVIPVFHFDFQDYLLASICGGVLGGAGLGFVFSASSSTGGTDLLATLIQGYKKHISVPQILNIIDAAIIILGAFVFGIGNALYAIISVFITAKISDSILEGLKFAKMAFIISDDYDRIAQEILHSLDRGVTGINAKGMYSNKDKRMLFCVVSKKEIVRIIEISQKIDPRAFVIISDVREVMGEGFIEYRQ